MTLDDVLAIPLSPENWDRLELLTRRRRNDPYGFEDKARISWSLYFKHETEYLTNQGWPLGTCCWALQVEAYGLRKIFCDANVNAAVLCACAWIEGMDEREAA